MAGTAQSSGEAAQHGTAQHGGKHVHHGRTPAAWAGTTIALVAFIVGALAVVLANWTVFWIAVGLVVVALIVTVVLQRMGYGAN